MKTVGRNLNILSLPFRLIGINLGKTVSVIQLSSGDLIIHSTADFDQAHVSEIRKLGDPRWILDSTNFHDTSVRAGLAAFPDAAFLAPPGFPKGASLNADNLGDPPADWNTEIEVIKIEGMPKINEHAIMHHPSKTLIVADLLFNIPESASRYTRKGLELISGIKTYPGNSRLFRSGIKDKTAFTRSLHRITQLDFEQIVVGHGDPVKTDAKAQLKHIFEALDFSIGADS